MSLTEEFEIQIEDVEVNISIPVKRYRTDAGVPTCARNFQSGEVCVFLDGSLFLYGTGGNCLFIESTTNQGVARYKALVEAGKSGFLEPHKDCPIWNKQ